MYSSSPIAAWRNQASAYRLEGVSCDKCAAVFFPRKYRCLCKSTNFSTYQFSGKATLISFTQVLIPPVEFGHYTPYCIGLLKLEEGPTVLMQLADISFEELYSGLPMVAVFRRYSTAGTEGMIFYGIKFASAELI